METNVIQGLLINKNSYTMGPNIIAFLSHSSSEDKSRNNIWEVQTLMTCKIYEVHNLILRTHLKHN
jgi:hypothetical protein